MPLRADVLKATWCAARSESTSVDSKRAAEDGEVGEEEKETGLEVGEADVLERMALSCCLLLAGMGDDDGDDGEVDGAWFGSSMEKRTSSGLGWPLK